MKKKSISYAKWGYIFLIPFFVVYLIFSLVPMLETFGYSFLDYVISQGSVSSIRGGGGTSENIINNGFCGFKNYGDVLKSGGLFSLSFKNTAILWLVGFIPQIIVSLLLASWFTDIRLKLKAQGFFKTVMYLPNVIMASALSLLFYSLFIKNGAVDTMLGHPEMLNNVNGARIVVGLINFLMWYGNTTILLMAAMMGIDTSLYEAAQIDGANPSQTFWQITIPLIKPILAYVLVTYMIGGLQMYDVPALLTNDTGKPAAEYANGKPYLTTKTIIMEIQTRKDSDVGKASAVCVIIFFISAIVGFALMYVSADKDGKKKKKKGARG